MADTIKKLYRGVPTTISSTLYTVPATTTSYIKSISLCNTTASPAEITLQIDSVTIVNSTISANNTVVINDIGVMTVGELLTGSQVTTNAISVWISGMEVV
jgi:hypothetical protein